MQTNRQIYGLDLVRAMAALFVMLYHLGFWIWSGAFPYHDGGYAMSYHWLAPYVSFGWIGVEVFFVLSGFVIAYSASSSNALDFARSRIVRLYPSAGICATFTILILLIFHVGRPSLLQSWIYSLLLFVHGPYIDGSYWTLPIEIFFYAIIFLLLVFRSFARLQWVMLCLAIFSATVNVYLWHSFYASVLPVSHAAYWLNTFVDDWRLGFILPHYGIFFAFGALLWLSLFKRRAPMLIFGMAICVPGAVAEIFQHSQILDHATSTNFSWVVPAMVWVGAVTAIITSVKLNPSFANVLGPRGITITRKLGLMTYPLYLVHQQVGYALIGHLKPVFGDIGAFLLVCVLMIGLSYVIVTFLEKPLQRLFRHALGASPKATPTPAASLP